MAPEAIHSMRLRRSSGVMADPSMDVYSFGLVMVQTLSRRASSISNSQVNPWAFVCTSFSPSWRNMPRLHKVFAGASRFGEHLDGAGSIGRTDTGGNTLARIDKGDLAKTFVDTNHHLEDARQSLVKVSILMGQQKPSVSASLN